MFDLGGRIRDHVDTVAPPIDLAELRMREEPAIGAANARREPMFKRSMTMLATSFAVVLITGIAFAQIGPMGDDEPVDEPPAATETTIPEGDGAIVDGEEPKDEAPADEPREGDEPTEEKPGDEPKDDDEPKDGAGEGEPKEEEPADTKPPEFLILHPVDGQHFEEREVVFEGHVEPGARVFAGDFEAEVDEDGTWRIVLLLNEGQNVATLKAIDTAGNTSTDSVTIFYDVPDEEPGEGDGEGDGDGKPGDGEEDPGDGDKPGDGDEPAEVEFTANQKYGTCAEEIPFDEFWGKATPGTTVYVESPYGGGTVVAGETGEWYIRVEFPEAPVGVTFDVVIEGDGGRKVFSFTRTEGDGGHEG